MKRINFSAILLYIHLLYSSTVYAKEGWAWELGMGLADSSEEFFDDTLDTEIGIETGIAYNFTSSFGNYTGLDVYTFDAEDSIDIVEVVASDYGLTLGCNLPEKFHPN